MATTIVIVCPECDKQIKAPETVLGKKVRCKFCQAAFVAEKGGSGKAGGGKAPAAVKPAPAPPPPPKPAAADEDDDDEGPSHYGMTEISLAPRCPDCANDMEEGQIICLHCGYNTVTRERSRMVKTYDQTFMEKFLWLLPGIACALTALSFIGFDIWFLLRINAVSKANGDPWYLYMFTNGGVKLWVIIISLFIIFFTSFFAIKRLVINYKRPEVEKLK